MARSVLELYGEVRTTGGDPCEDQVCCSGCCHVVSGCVLHPTWIEHAERCAKSAGKLDHAASRSGREKTDRYGDAVHAMVFDTFGR